MTQHITLREVGLRDGLQIVKTIVPTQAKMEWIREEYSAGVKEIEVCSFVPAKLIPQFADSTEIVADSLRIRGLTVSALIPNMKGAQRGVELGVHKLNYVMSVSEGHNLANVRRTVAESLEDFSNIVAMLREVPAGSRPKLSGGLSTSFGCTIEGRVSEDRVVELAERLVESGADEIVIADTVGYGGPHAVRRVFERVLARVGSVPVFAHFHDTRGLGLANAVGALDAGVRYFDATLAGLGGCPHAPGATGNVVIEDLAFLCETMGYATGIDIGKLVAVRHILARELPNEKLSGAIAVAGLPREFPKAAASA
ncbi:MAG: hydroxymethylglutaryl-CoA lyase [Polaromonas sp.]|jgi:hydroxymethylglutaryl-CoA lyase|nr:hydroxymethylglutaryl-CoA lyase [Polaromonas sp.]